MENKAIIEEFKLISANLGISWVTLQVVCWGWPRPVLVSCPVPGLVVR